jgi:predicted amidophosphoribosyltransferase
MEGVEVEEKDTETHAPQTCPRCDKESPRDEDVCMWCGQAFDAQTAQELDAAEDALFESVAQADDNLIDDLRAARELLDDPDVRALLARDGGG